MPRRHRRRRSYGADQRLWLYGPVPRHFWDEREHQRLYFEWLGEQLGFKEPDDWYEIQVVDFQRNRGAGLLRRYYGSPSAAVMSIFPRRDWKEWLFQTAPQGFWSKAVNRGRYLKWLGQELGYRTPDAWYAITEDDFLRHYGRQILKRFKDSPTAVVRSHFSEVHWQEWLFGKVPRTFWDDRRNRRRYMVWLGRQLGFRTPSDWYRLRATDFIRNRGSACLAKFRGSAIAAAREFLPHRTWHEWLFTEVPKGWWDRGSNRRKYMAWLERQLRIVGPEQWYDVTVWDFRRHGGMRLLRYFGNSPSAAVKDYYPRYPWLEWYFATVPSGFWNERQNRRRYMDWLGHELGFTRSEDWYRLRFRDFKDHNGAGLLAKFGWSRLALLADYRPKYRWDADRLVSPTRTPRKKALRRRS